MLRIRLRRVGKRGKPSYRIVVADVRAPRDGAYLEWIGNYDPMADPPAVTIKRDRAEEWLSKGAQPSDAVKRILQWQDIIEREPLDRNPQRKKAAPEPATLVQTAPAPAAPAATVVAAVLARLDARAVGGTGSRAIVRETHVLILQILEPRNPPRPKPAGIRRPGQGIIARFSSGSPRSPAKGARPLGPSDTR